MAFKSFQFKLIIRLLVLTAILFLFSYCLAEALYLRSMYVGVLAVLLVCELTFFVTRFVGNVNSFLSSLLQQDFTIHFKEDESMGNFRSLYATLNLISRSFKKISSEKEIKHRYLEALVEHIRIGIVSFDAEGNIHLVNKTFLELIDKPGLNQLSSLKKSHEKLADVLSALRPEETQVFKFYRNNQLINLALHASEFKLDDKHFKLVSSQNITHELNASEMDAWQKLIKVLTHEIMNSISPVISLSGTLHTIIKKQNGTPESMLPSDWNTIHAGLEAIKIRSEGLHYFTEKYRKLTHLPEPDFQVTDVKVFIERMVSLLQPELDEHHIQLMLKPETAHIRIDGNLMEQAVINLIRNAIEALHDCQSPVIKIESWSSGGRVHLAVSDNGPGIENENLERIFVPFYTTKKNGSGIGLALVRQIVLLHKGEIFVHSDPFHKTVFTVVF